MNDQILTKFIRTRFESEYQSLINRREKVGFKELKNSKVSINYWQTIVNIRVEPITKWLLMRNW